MPFPLGAAIGAAGGIIGNLLSGSSNAAQAERNYRHRYQWQVEDMKKAGLNPALAYGSNAPIPQTQPLEPLGDSANKGAQAGAASAYATAQTDLLRAQTQVYKATAFDLEQQAKLRNALLFTQTEAAGASASLSLRQQEVANETIKRLQLDNTFNERTMDDRIQIVQKALKAKGLDIDIKDVTLMLQRLRRPGAEAEAQLFDSLGAGGTSNALQLLRLLVGALK